MREPADRGGTSGGRWQPSVTQLADRVVSEQPILPVSPGALARARQREKTGLGAVLRAYVALTKPRIIELLLVTTLPSMILAADGLPDWTTVLATMVGGTLAAASANALNCYLDRDIDAVMRRTGHRPLARQLSAG